MGDFLGGVAVGAGIQFVVLLFFAWRKAVKGADPTAPGESDD